MVAAAAAAAVVDDAIAQQKWVHEVELLANQTRKWIYNEKFATPESLFVVKAG